MRLFTGDSSAVAHRLLPGHVSTHFHSANMKRSSPRGKTRSALGAYRDRGMARVLVIVAAALLAMPLVPRRAVAQTAGTSRAEDASVAKAPMTWKEQGFVPGDALVITIWREPDLSGTFLVHEDGVVTLPMLGRVPVAGITVVALRDTLTRRYARDLREPIITVEHRRRVFVLGQVKQPGLLTLDPTVSLTGAVSLAGGSSEGGDLRRLKIVRDGSVLQTQIDPDRPLGDLPLRSGDQIHVGRQGWFDRNSAFMVSVVLSTASVFAALLR
jgi:polysaccharide export outer membrane protein